MVKQLVRHARVRTADIVVYDARRNIYPALLIKIWSEFPEVRFVQWDAPEAAQPVNPAYNSHAGWSRRNGWKASATR